MGAHDWEVHGDDGSQYGHCDDEHRTLAWMYAALDQLSGSGWGMLTTPDGSWRADRDAGGEISWTAL